MNLNFLLSHASMFEREVLRFCDEGDMVVRSFKCEEQLIVMTYRKMVIYFCDRNIDFTIAPYDDLEIIKTSESTCVIKMNDTEFDISTTKESIEKIFELYNRYIEIKL